jgi:hypothetical protein
MSDHFKPRHSLGRRPVVTISPRWLKSFIYVYEENEDLVGFFSFTTHPPGSRDGSPIRLRGARYAMTSPLADLSRRS